MPVKIRNMGEPAGMVTMQMESDDPDVQITTEGWPQYPDLQPGEEAYPFGPGFSWEVIGQSGWCMPAEFDLRLDGIRALRIHSLWT